MRFRRGIAGGLIAQALCSAPAAADPSWAALEPSRAAFTVHLSRTSTACATARDREVQARLTELRVALEDTQLHAQLWTWGWLSFYVLGFGIQTTRAALADQSSARGALTVSAVKAAIGITSLSLRLPRARLGADEIPAADPLDPEGNLAALRLAEAALREDARRARRRTSWIAHASSLLLTTAGVLIVGLGFDDWPRALRNGALSIAFGEMVIWSQPWQPDNHWQDYRARYPSVAP